MGESLKSVPEIFEQVVEECLVARTRAIGFFVDMGPPDLCHIKKVLDQSSALIKSKVVELGSYHYIYGLDTSTPASIAAYFNTLYYAQGKGSWKIQSGTYCSYNAFTKTDVRVEVTMPGSVNCYALDQNGQRYNTDDRTWHELFVCSVIRAKGSPSPFHHHIDCLRKFEPLSSLSSETSFLNSAKVLFWEAKYLGSSDLTAPSNNINNRMVRCIEEHFVSDSRFLQMIDFFTQFADEENEVNLLIAKAQYLLGQCSKALCVLSTSLQKNPLSASMLIYESEVLRNQGNIDFALMIAKIAVDVAPAQAQSWLNLAKIYTCNKQYSQALISLNVSPMAQWPPFSLPDMPEPLRMMNNNENLLLLAVGEEEGDEGLLALPGQNIKDTFAEAYRIVSLINREVGWDQLLAYRSKVFVMEEEYNPSSQQKKSLLHNSPPSQTNDEDPNFSIHRSVSSTSSTSQTKLENGNNSAEFPEEQNSEDQIEAKTPAEPHPEIPSATKGSITTVAESSSSSIQLHRLPSTSPASSRARKGHHSSGKRLCERWLDYLFTALYQDLKYFSIWVAQEQHAAKTNQKIPLTVGDWLRFGSLAERLHKKEDAYRAYRACTEINFSLRAWLSLLKLYSDDGFIEETFEAIDQISKFYKQNTNLELPSQLRHSIFRLIAKHGLDIVSKNGGPRLKENPIISRYLQEARTWQVHGSI